MALPIDFSTYSFDPLFVNAVIGIGVNAAKNSEHPWMRWISDATPHVSRSVQACLAAISAAGMTISYTTADDGSMAVTVAGITVAGVMSFVVTASKNMMVQMGTSGAIDAVRRMKETEQVLIDLKQQLNN